MNRTYIFTFDSLGGKHPGAIRNLGNYLQMEARDKKGLDNSQTTLPTGCNALVCLFVSFKLESPRWLIFFAVIGSRAAQLLRLRSIPDPFRPNIHV